MAFAWSAIKINLKSVCVYICMNDDNSWIMKSTWHGEAIMAVFCIVSCTQLSN